MPPEADRSLLARLICEEPAEGGGSGMRRDGHHDPIESIRTDLENLLNTRWRCLSWPPNLEELDRSLVNYGIPDFSGISFGNVVGQRELRRVLEECIRRFEPRLRRVRILPPERDHRQDRTLHFRIEAEIGDGSSRRSIAFETSLDATTAYFQVGFSRR